MIPLRINSLPLASSSFAPSTLKPSLAVTYELEVVSLAVESVPAAVLSAVDTTDDVSEAAELSVADVACDAVPDSVADVVELLDEPLLLQPVNSIHNDITAASTVHFLVFFFIGFLPSDYKKLLQRLYKSLCIACYK